MEATLRFPTRSRPLAAWRARVQPPDQDSREQGLPPAELRGWTLSNREQRVVWLLPDQALQLTSHSAGLMSLSGGLRSRGKSGHELRYNHHRSVVSRPFFVARRHLHHCLSRVRTSRPRCAAHRSRRQSSAVAPDAWPSARVGRAAWASRAGYRKVEGSAPMHYPSARLVRPMLPIFPSIAPSSEEASRERPCHSSGTP